MKIIDSFMYFDEDMMLDIRLNTLNEYVSKFIICEAKFNHKGIRKKLNFDFKNFQKFKDKIEYIVLEDQPNNILEISDKDSIEEKNSKILDNALMRENFQRNYCLKNLKNFNSEDLILINDLDEIPNLKNFTYRTKITIFIQKMFYYKLNLIYPNFDWMGSKICKIKNLLSPQWLRNIKPKKYPKWRLDVFFSKKKSFDLSFVVSGGWHFTNVKSVEKIDFKMRNFLHHLEYEESGMNIDTLKKFINEKRVMYDHKADKKNTSKWMQSKNLEKCSIERLPNYIKENKSKFSKWMD